MKATIILGAGACAPFGVPTLRNLFLDDQARAYLREKPDLLKVLEEVFWNPRGKTLESSDESLTVEEILTLLRDSERGQFSKLTGALLSDRNFLRNLYVLIKRAVYDGKSSSRRCLNPILSFARARFDHTTWASFNWDCLFESSFYYSSGAVPMDRFNPSLVIPLVDWRPGSPKHVFLKLHGGINWWAEGGALTYLPFGSQPNLDAKWAGYEKGATTGNPVILEPSYYKYSDPTYELLKPQWPHFVTSLLNADAVIVIGYSLPESDSEARTAVTLGFQQNPQSRWVVIDRSADTCNRYRHLLGTARVAILEKSLEDLNDDLEAAIGPLLGLKAGSPP